jgi:hypothetical protein
MQGLRQSKSFFQEHKDGTKRGNQRTSFWHCKEHPFGIAVMGFCIARKLQKSSSLALCEAKHAGSMAPAHASLQSADCFVVRPCTSAEPQSACDCPSSPGNAIRG